MKNECVFLYLLRCDDFFKIGITANIRARMMGYRCMNPHSIELIKYISFSNRFFARTAENTAHGHLKKMGKHHRGEWFKDCSISEIENALTHAESHANCEILHLKYKISQRLRSRHKCEQGIKVLADKEKAIKCKKIIGDANMAKNINKIGVKKLAKLSGIKQSKISEMRRSSYAGYARYSLSDLSFVVSLISGESKSVEGAKK